MNLATMRRRRSLQLLGWLALAAMATLALLGTPPWPGGGFTLGGPDSAAPPPPEVARHPFWNYDPLLQEARDPEQSCSMPVVHPLHPSVWPHLKPTVPIRCKVLPPFSGGRPLVEGCIVARGENYFQNYLISRKVVYVLITENI
ncbi:hypothetical protein HPB48_008062 [Haemaphysalis longicornis]|uniref:Uncharacterized protein n=1 Tax=Haemaphysalis longicornis TaxID=44386 RepID=A0A9J6FR20_HAELO|nr:hypothetical protein HPB48_008062 [Haemaphysalis longicornis]